MLIQTDPSRPTREALPTIYNLPSEKCGGRAADQVRSLRADFVCAILYGLLLS
ncbi:MAG: hypothetical protein MOB07_07250 [Acidobacteria bacterium]|nr:hypothetical protein [Acidobacteriota bacterium]